jgi:hypothetical protein
MALFTMCVDVLPGHARLRANMLRQLRLICGRASSAGNIAYMALFTMGIHVVAVRARRSAGVFCKFAGASGCYRPCS